MTMKLPKSDELREALDAGQETAVYLVDADGHPTHVVLPLEDARLMFQDYLHRELRKGFEQADRGQFVAWDPEKIKAEGRAALEQPGDSP